MAAARQPSERAQKAATAQVIQARQAVCPAHSRDLRDSGRATRPDRAFASDWQGPAATAERQVGRDLRTQHECSPKLLVRKLM